MKKNDYIEVFGGLEKIEEFSTIHENIVHGSLVFESLSPFRGYYNDGPHDSSPIYIYFAIDKVYPVFEIVRAARNTREQTGLGFDAAKAYIKFNDRNFNVIRLRHFQGFDKINTIQEGFSHNGIKLQMSSGKWKNVQVHTTFNKVFSMIKFADGITLDADEENHAYIEIPRQLSFSEFEILTEKVRNNWFETKFDAALGYYLLKDRVVDFVRIYSSKLDEKYLSGLKKLYLDKMM